MKKKYLKPEAEYISLEAKDIVTNEDEWVPGANMSTGEFTDW